MTLPSPPEGSPIKMWGGALRVDRSIEPNLPVYSQLA